MDEKESVVVDWYRVPLPREEMRKLSRRSDVKGLAQALGHLGLLACTGSLAYFSAYHWAWWVTVLITFMHGTFWAFCLNAFHELCHGGVFKTKALNAFFLRVFSFLGQYNYVHFQESHKRHHRYTLHQPDDLEVVLPIKHTIKDYLLTNVVNLRKAFVFPRGLLNISRGIVAGEWTTRILPATGETRRQEYINWARVLVIGHALILAVSIVSGHWMLAVLVTFAPYYGSWLMFLCNSTQHVGLQDNVSDFRLSCRTIHINPFLRFLYWHMNYHIEHHMYAGIPCYNLRRLHKLIEPHLPPTPNGLIETWKQIGSILERQKREPGYQFVAAVPETS